MTKATRARYTLEFKQEAVRLVEVGIGAIVATPILIKRARDKNVASISTIAHPADGAVAVDASMRQKDYVKWVTPRIPSMPWTAPAYDAATVQVQPRVFCIAADDGQTRCITEQGTDYDLPAADARQIAAHGVYNPFLRPAEDRRRDVEKAQPDGKPQARPGEPSQRPDVLAASGGGAVGPQSEPLPQSVMRADYVPPQYMPPNQ